MTEIKERGDRMEEACGVFGIYAQDEAINVAEAAYYGLFAFAAPRTGKRRYCGG